MLNLDKAEVDYILLQLEDGKYLDTSYEFCREDNEFVLIGSGAFSGVYEMADCKNPKIHYAAKVVGLGAKEVQEEIMLRTIQLQQLLGETSEHILKTLAVWTMKIQLDENNCVKKVVKIEDMGYEETDGVLIQIVLMEKLQHIFFTDRYGNSTLLREELRTEKGVTDFARQIGKALHFIHENHILHRDIKLENIFWDEEHKQYKLGDFGSARDVSRGNAETIIFTDGYGAPEIKKQLVKSYYETADIYSLGITMFLLLNDLNFPVSEGYHVNDVQYGKNFIFPAPIHASEGMARIIRRMCSYQVEERYQTINEVILDLGTLEEKSKIIECEAYEDVATETYVEENESHDAVEANGEIPWWEKDPKDLNREEQKKSKKSSKELYVQSSLWVFGFLVVLFFLLGNSLSVHTDTLHLWMVWTLPILLLLEAIFQGIGEFSLGFGIATIAFALFSMFTLGISIPIVIMIVVVIIGIPVVTVGCALGFGFWMICMNFGVLSWLAFVREWKLSWILFVCIFAVIDFCVMERVEWEYETKIRYIMWNWFADKIGFILAGIGMILFLINCFHLVAVPEPLQSMHFVWMGLGMLIAKIILLKQYGLLEEDI